jgi:DNA polymerase-3 subunit gamma/tau
MEAQARRIPPDRLVETIKLFNEAGVNMRIGFHPQLPLEMALVEATSMDAEEEQAQRSSPPPAGPAQRRNGAPPSIQPPPPVPVRETAARTEVAPKASAPLEQVRERWPQILAAIKPHSRNVEALLKSCEPVAVEGSTVTLGFYYAFHKEKVEEPHHTALVEQAVSQVLGASHRVKCTMSSRDRPHVEEERPRTKYDIASEDPLIQAAVKKYGAHIADVQSPSSG